MENSKSEIKPTILKDAMALFIVTLVCALGLSFVYEITKSPIAQREMEKKLVGYQVVYTEAARLAEDEELTKLALNINLTTYDAAYKNVTVDEVNKAYDSSDALIGYIIKVTTKGYANPISLAIGYSLDGMVKGIETLEINDTAGMGMNAKNPEFKNQFAGKKVDKFVVTKTGATEENQINAISGATVTTDAVVNAVNAGIDFLKRNAADLGGGAGE